MPLPTQEWTNHVELALRVDEALARSEQSGKLQGSPIASLTA